MAENSARLASLNSTLDIINNSQKTMNTNINNLKLANKNVQAYLDSIIPPELASLLNGKSSDKDSSAVAGRKLNAVVK